MNNLQRILIVDDEILNRRLLRILLDKHGSCSEAKNGFEAVQSYSLSVQESKRYALILMDIMMPTMDGLEAVERIRALEAEHQIFDVDRAKIIMITTLADHDSVLAAKHVGIDGYVLKPYDRQRLLNEIRSCGITLSGV